MENITRALLVMDGNYVRKCYNHLASEVGFEGNLYSIDFDALIKQLSVMIEKDFGSRCVFTAKKLYIGTNAEVDSLNQEFYRSVDDAGIQRTAYPLQSGKFESGRPSLKEEGVDVAISYNTAKDFFSASKENRFDTLVLFAGDGDLTPLVSGLHSEGVKVVVVYYDFSTPFSTTRASQKLLESADMVVDFGAFLTERVNKNIIAIFKKIDDPSRTPMLPPRKKVVVVRKGSPFSAGEKDFFSGREYTREEIADAIRSNPRKDADGYVLVSQLGKYLEYTTGATLPLGVKLKDLLSKYRAYFETKELPAYSVRIVGNQK